MTALDAGTGSPEAGRALAVLDRISDLEVLVVGDLVLDEWLFGEATRLCREAPVPVVEVRHTRPAPGAGGNAAVAAAALGARVRCVGITGDDPAGEQLRRSLQEYAVDTTGVVLDPQASTPAKRRLVADDQVLARFDESGRGYSTAALAAMADAAVGALAEVDVVMVCDYGNGAAGDVLRAALAGARSTVHGPLLVDGHELLDWREVRPTVMTPNGAESCQLLGRRPGAGEELLTMLRGSSAELLERTASAMVVTTVDAQGALLHLPDQPAYRTRPRAAAAPLGPCGAGDTFAATFAVALGADADPRLAAGLAQIAADVVVARPGTAVCTAADLLGRISEGRPIDDPLARVADVVEQLRQDGKRVVFTNGCFDLLHRGHLSYLQQARDLGDVLVVGVNSDDSVRRLKGRDRPLVPQQERAELLASLAPVDVVAVFDGDTASDLIEMVRPDLYVKGGDYTAEMLPEAELVRSLGGEVVLVDYVDDRSTTGIVERIRQGGS